MTKAAKAYDYDACIAFSQEQADTRHEVEEILASLTE